MVYLQHLAVSSVLIYIINYGFHRRPYSHAELLIMAGLSVKGRASVLIDGQELKALLQFIPDPELTGFDYDVILRLISDKQLTPLPPPKMIEEFLLKASKSKVPIEIIINEGVPPEQPVPETVEWEELPFPDDIVPFVEETLANAKPPELYKTKVEKVKRESLVKVPSKIPFMPSKEEIVVNWDKKETKEPVTVDPGSAERRYALKETRLGIFHPQKPGKPGKNVFGRPIQPKVLEEAAFLLGEGLYRERNEIKSSLSGIIRIGKNWADVVPLAKPAWEVAKGSDGVTLFLRFEPGDSRFQAPTGNDIIAKAKELGAPEENLIPSEMIENEIRKAVSGHEDLEVLPLFKTREAEARVIFSPQNVRAVLYLRKGVAGALPLQMKTISEVIRNSGVQGMDAEKLKADISAFMKSPQVELKDYVLAEGKDSTRGADKEIVFSVEFFRDEEKNEHLKKLKQIPQWHLAADSGDLFPPAEATDAAVVAQDTKVAEVTNSSPGADGRDVFGNVLPGQPGNDPELRLFQGLRQHGRDIIAEKPGLLLVKQEGSSLQMEILDYRDGLVMVHISDDKMEVRVELLREIGPGKPLKFDMIALKLAEAGVIRGISKDAMEKAYEIVLGQGQGHCPPYLVAKGEAPVSGGGSSVKWLVPYKKGSKESQLQFAPVKEGTALAEIQVEGEEGRPGFDVLGTVLSPEQGTSVSLEHNNTIKEEPFGRGIRLIAAGSGELSLKGKQLSILSMRSVKGNVGPETGNITFSGEIRIAGDVMPGFQVIGNQDVLIGGIVEAALVSAGGKVIISQGVIGAGKGVIRARKNIDASFIEQATLLAVEDIRIQNGCVGCSVKTNGKLFLVGEKGNLTGGICKARHGVNAASIGSEQGRTTEISFGQDYLVKDQIEGTEREIEKVKAAIIMADRKINQAEGIETALAAARTEKVKLMKLLEQLGFRLFTLREKFEEHHESEIRVRGIIFPGVVMESHDRYYEVKQKRSQVIFYFDRETGRIKERPLEASSK